MRSRKGNFTLISLHDWCPPAKTVICPWRVVPLLFVTPVTDHFLTFSALHIWFPFNLYLQLEPRAADFADFKQAYDEASSQYRQDLMKLIIASDMQSGTERNSKMAALCSACLHAVTSDVSTAGRRTSMERGFFFSYLISPLSSHRK